MEEDIPDLERFETEIWAIIDYCSREYRLSNAEVIGCLEMIKLQVFSGMGIEE